MGTGQSLFGLIAMMLLTMITTRVNSTLLTTQDTTQNSKYALLAVSIANSKLQQAIRLSFDENTVLAQQTSASGMSTTMGKESGETTETTFDDCDDYNGFTARDSVQNSAPFDISMTVGYVNPSTPDVITTTKTLHKKVIVRVTSPYMRDTISMSTICSYWPFQ
ncbi:MAG: hypothetical protein LWX56_05370 [Ignavibacteria bacterium]|nr:hypothetical protein [Ignavibacteria bacterium]